MFNFSIYQLSILYQVSMKTIDGTKNLVLQVDCSVQVYNFGTKTFMIVPISEDVLESVDFHTTFSQLIVVK